MNEGVRRRFWGALLSGVLGGALAGAADAGAVLIAGRAGGRAPLLVLLSAGLAGMAGLLLAGLALAIARGVARLRRRVSVPEDAAWAVSVLAAPVLVYDAFALFSGSKASRLPGRQVLSVVLAAGALVLLWRLARRVAGVLWHAEEGRGRRRWALALAAAAAVAAGAVAVANRVVLPRLYPWFHTALALAYFALAVTAVRAAIASGARRAGLLRLAPATMIASFVSLCCAAAAWPDLLQNHALRFAAIERTPLTGVFLRALPLPPPRQARGMAKRPAGADDAPLPEGPRRPGSDVVLITVDALRADHLGLYGYGRPTSPNLDALAKRSVVFERAYAQAPHTSFSVASMLTGKYYPTIARLAPGDVHDPVTTVLRRYGWKTAAFYPPAVFYVDAEKLKAYQESHFEFEWVKEEFLGAEERLAQIDEFFTTETPGKAFLWLHLFEPHEPYEKRAGFDFGDKDVDRYDSEIAYTDAVIGKLLAYIEEKRPGAIVIVTADHGEEFDEHGGRYHGSSLFEEQVRVPLIVHVPGVPGHRVAGPVELIDLAPTVLGLLDIPAPMRMRGTDLGPWLTHPGGAPSSRLPPAFAELENKRMIAWGMEKLICDLNFGYCEYFDLASDPGEKSNRADERPDRVAALRERLDDWLDDHGRFEPHLLAGLANPDGRPVPKALERGRLADLSALPELLALLTSAEPAPVRREAARLLVMVLPPRKNTREALVAALDADDPVDPQRFAIAATRLGDERARARLVPLVQEAGADPEVRVQAALALAQAGEPVGVPVLAEGLSTCDSVPGCRLIILALGQARDPRGVPALLGRLDEVMNRRETVLALGEIGDGRAVGALAERLAGDEYVPVRAEAAGALAKIGGPAALAALRKARGVEQEALVLGAIEAALERLAPAVKAPASGPPARPGKARSPRPGPGR